MGKRLDTDLSKKFGLSMSKWRNDAGYTISKLSEYSGIERHTLYRYELGIANPTLRNLVTLANIFGTGVDEYIGLVEPCGNINYIYPPDDWNDEYIGTFMLKKRKEKHYYQNDLAFLAGLGSGTLSSYETGKYSPTMSNLVAIIDVLGCSINEYIGLVQTEE